MLFFNRAYVEVPSVVELSTISDEPSTNGQKRQSWARRYLRGWRFTAMNGAILSFIIFLFNVIATVIACNVKVDDYFGNGKPLLVGDCEKVRKMNIETHFAINLMSTILLSVSNYGMQCLSAPTRTEVDSAHSKSYWLDIGVLSVRNISRISRKRAILWAMLSISSLPLHLL